GLLAAPPLLPPFPYTTLFRSTPASSQSPLSELRTVAPAKAPMAPGRPMRTTSGQDTLPNRQWDTPDVNVVPSLARCTPADAEARSEEHTSELQSRENLVCRLL